MIRGPIKNMKTFTMAIFLKSLITTCTRNNFAIFLISLKPTN